MLMAGIQTDPAQAKVGCSRQISNSAHRVGKIVCWIKRTSAPCKRHDFPYSPQPQSPFPTPEAADVLTTASSQWSIPPLAPLPGLGVPGRLATEGRERAAPLEPPLGLLPKPTTQLDVPFPTEAILIAAKPILIVKK